MTNIFKLIDEMRAEIAEAELVEKLGTTDEVRETSRERIAKLKTLIEEAETRLGEAKLQASQLKRAG